MDLWLWKNLRPSGIQAVCSANRDLRSGWCRAPSSHEISTNPTWEREDPNIRAVQRSSCAGSKGVHGAVSAASSVRSHEILWVEILHRCCSQNGSLWVTTALVFWVQSTITSSTRAQKTSKHCQLYGDHLWTYEGPLPFAEHPTSPLLSRLFASESGWRAPLRSLFKNFNVV